MNDDLRDALRHLPPEEIEAMVREMPVEVAEAMLIVLSLDEGTVAMLTTLHTDDLGWALARLADDDPEVIR